MPPFFFSCFITNFQLSFLGGDYMDDWITVKEAAKRKKCTTANIMYYIKQGKVEAIKEGSRWKINPETLETKEDFINTSETVLEVFKNQLEEKDKQIALLQEQVGNLHQLLALEKQEKAMLLEDRRPWYKRLFDRKEVS